MSETEWTAVAAVAASISALFAALATGISVYAAREVAKSDDVQSCLSTVEKISDAQRRIRDAVDPMVKDYELREFLNLLETLALFINKKRASLSTRLSMTPFLEEVWAQVQVDPKLRALVEGSVTGTDTFVELSKFAKKREDRIARLIRHYQTARDPTADI